MVRIRILPFAFVLIALLIPEGAAADSATRIIVKREPGLTAAERADIRADAGVRLIETLSLPRTEVVAAGEAAQALRELRADEDVVYAEIDHIRHSVVGDDYMSSMWGLRNTGQQLFLGNPGSRGFLDADSDVVEAWSQIDDALDVPPGDGQVVAVVDTGADETHPDLLGRILSAENFVGVSADATDGNGHGTHVSGTIAANRYNGEGGAGVAPGASIVALRALNDDGEGLDSDIAEAFHRAGQDNIPIVNASLGGPDASQVLEDAIAPYPDTLFVFAAGNDATDNDSVPQYPCNIELPNVLCVGASTNRDARASFSNYGDESVDLFAPGDYVLSTVPLGVVQDFEAYEYLYMSGTSMASPHVAAAAALVLQADPNLSAVQVKDLLMATADDQPAFAAHSVSGGRLNAGVAVATVLELGSPVDTDTDGHVDAVDMCPNVAVPSGPEGCPTPDDDADTIADYADNCPAAANTNQVDLDDDGQGDACDPDVDGDGVANGSDVCDTAKGPASNSGCPVVAVTPTPTPDPPVSDDRDRDGRADASDACPSEFAVTNDGCPLPAVAALSARAKKCGRGLCASVRIHTSRVATIRVTFERKKCTSGRCRWVRVSRKTTTTNRSNVARVTSERLKRGKYRAVVVLSSSAGRATPVTDGFRVR